MEPAVLLQRLARKTTVLLGDLLSFVRTLSNASCPCGAAPGKRGMRFADVRSCRCRRAARL